MTCFLLIKIRKYVITIATALYKRTHNAEFNYFTVRYERPKITHGKQIQARKPTALPVNHKHKRHKCTILRVVASTKKEFKR